MMDERSLEVLEFPRVLDLAARHAGCRRGAERLRALAPATELDAAARRLDLTAELRRLLMSADGFPPIELPDSDEALVRLTAAGVVLDVADLRDLARVARTARLVRERLNGDNGAHPLAAALAARLVAAPHFEKAVADTFDDHGEILDTASGALRTIRRHARQQREKIVARLESYRKGDDAERTVTLRADRYVIAVRASEKGDVGGIVHDRSGSGATVYLEPMALLEENNRLIELLVEEREEIRRILAALSDMARGLREPLLENIEVLAELDMHRAMARLAEGQKALRPGLVADGSRIILKAFRHPLLAEARAVVPLDLVLTREERLLLITGPNMGGKTVAMKGVGLACLMASVGMHLPAADGTEVVILQGIVADIGDEQSIEQDLSTFASHLTRWAKATDAAAPGQLALLDEIGAGTDPAEGAALAQAVLERLADGGGYVVATTHLGALKKFASEHPGVVNGSMRFDPATQQPLYRLDQGIPGQSRAIEMARRLGLDPVLVDRASGLIGREEQDVQALLTQLEVTRRDLEAEKARVGDEIARADDVRTKYEERVRKLTADYQAVKARAGREGERLLAKAGDLLKEAEAEARSIRQKVLVDSKEAKLRVDRLKSTIRDTKEQAAGVARPEQAAPGRPVDASEARPGERFWAEPLQSWVTVVAAPVGQKVRVDRNGLRVELPVTALRAGLGGDGGGNTVRRSALDELPRDETKPRGGVSWSQPEKPMLEVDLRGLTAEEALDRLDLFLDEAMLGGAPEIRIIHGKGTGVLRTAVRKWLTGRTDIVSHRLGETYEGGTGVTVAKLE